MKQSTRPRTVDGEKEGLMPKVEDDNNWDWDTPAGLMTEWRRKQFVEKLVKNKGSGWIRGFYDTEPPLELDAELPKAAALERIAAALELMAGKAGKTGNAL